MSNKITIISATNRRDSYSLKIAQFISEQLDAKSVSNQILSFESLPHDFLFSNFNGTKNPEFQTIVDTYINSVNKFIFVIPEYNGSFPGILKGFIDCIPPKSFHHKHAALVGVADGHAGSLRSLDMWTLIMNYVRVNVHWNKPKLSDITNFYTDKGLSDAYSARLKSLIDDFC